MDTLAPAAPPAACFILDPGLVLGMPAGADRALGSSGPKTSMHAKMLRLLCTMAIVLGCLYCGYFLSMGMVAAAFAGLACVVVNLLVLGYADATRRYRAALEAGSVLLFAMLTTVSLFQDGVRSPALWWLSVPALVMILAGSKRLGATLCALFVAVVVLQHLHGPGSWGPVSLLARDSGLQLTLAMTLSALFLAIFAALSAHWSRQVRRALDRARRDALAASAEKAWFVSRVSHEIRTPLQGMIGVADVLQQPGLDPQRRAALAEVQRQSAGLLMALVNDVLDFSKLEAGKVTVERHPVRLAALIREAVELFAPQAAEKGLELAASCSPDVPDVLLGDALRIRQIVANLVSNAIKFTPRGSVHVHLGLEGGRADRSAAGRSMRVRIDVADSGIGIDERSLATLFKPFHQADASVTRRFGGTGLGLSIASDLARLMGGRIEVASTPGRGSTFTVMLPLGVPEGAVPPSSALSPGASAAAARVAPLPDGCVVLVAEDDPANQVVVAAMLDVLNVTAIVVADGCEALAVIGTRPIDCVLMDLHMPVLGGLDATRTLREREARGSGARTTVIAMTGSTEPEDAAACLGAGMDAILTKPFALAEMRRMLLDAWRRAPGKSLVNEALSEPQPC
jgi:signal transduction histidine kinase/CheY-like chemotaxis protein